MSISMDWFVGENRKTGNRRNFPIMCMENLQETIDVRMIFMGFSGFRFSLNQSIDQMECDFPHYIG